MQVSNNKNLCNAPNFGSVIPIRVVIDGQITTDQKLVEKSCRMFIKSLTTRPMTRNTHYKNVVNYMEKDMDYFPKQIFNERRTNPELTPSTFIRAIHTYTRGSFLVTGQEANILASIGRRIGIAKTQSQMAVDDAKKIYSNAIENILNNAKARVTEFCDRNTRQKSGDPVQLQLNMTSNGKYGHSTFKINIGEINFIK